MAGPEPRYVIRLTEEQSADALSNVRQRQSGTLLRRPDDRYYHTILRDKEQACFFPFR